MERIVRVPTDGEFAAVRMLRHYCGARDRDADGALSRLVALGDTLRLPPAASVALASVFQLTEAVLGRSLQAGCGPVRAFGADERAIVRLLGADLPVAPGTGTPEMPHGLPGALVWAVLSFRRLCGEAVPPRAEPASLAYCPFGRGG